MSLPATWLRSASRSGGRAGLDRHFLVIGAQRCGTTWLYRNLRQHPDLWLPPVKEIHFFDRAPRYPSHSHHAPARGGIVSP